MPIYTIGRVETYEAAFRGERPAIKRGRDGDYGGGWVWKSHADALDFLIRNGRWRTHLICYVDAEWEDMEVVQGKPYRLLLRPAPVRPIPGYYHQISPDQIRRRLLPTT